MGTLISASDVQQGDPLGPLIVCTCPSSRYLKIHYVSLYNNFWYLDDVVLSGPRAALSRAMKIIQGDSTLNGLLINFKKCQLLSKQDLSMFHPEILCCSTPDFEILGAPMAVLISALPSLKRKRKEANQLLYLLPKLCDPQSAIALFSRFDDVLHCLESTLEIELTPQACSQAQLGLKYGGLGLCSLTMHAQAAYVASLSTSLTPICTSERTMLFNAKVACCDQLSVEGVQVTYHHQDKLSSAIKKTGFLFCLLEHPQ